MKKTKKSKKSFPKKTALLLTASGLLLIGSTVGSTRAALTYYSENYSAQMNMSKIGVTLLENGEAVSHRDYADNGTWDVTGEGKLLENMLGKDGKFTPGKKYDEALSVQNSGDIDTFVRVIVTKNWQDKDGVADTALNPDWIELNVPDGTGWIKSQAEETKERSVFYYTSAVKPGEETAALSDSIRINSEIAQKVTKVVDGNTIKYEYDYNGYTFTVGAEVDAVQTHNAKEAIKSAWGVDVNVSGDEASISLQ